MAVEKWGSLVFQGNLLTDYELGGLAVNAASPLSAAFDNASLGYCYGVFFLSCSPYSPGSPPASLDVYAVCSYDGGTTYEDGGNGVIPLYSSLADRMFFRNSSGSHRLGGRFFALKPLWMKFCIVNRAANALAGSPILSFYTANKLIV